MKKAIEVANYFLAKSDIDAGDLLSNLKIQKLLYFAQGFSLAINNKPIFEEEIEAWLHGPVVPAVYQAFKVYGNQAVPVPKYFDFSRFTEEEQKLLDDVYDVYGQFSAWRLRDISHDPSGPWKQVFVLGENNIITHKALKAYFFTLTKAPDEE